MEIIEVLKKMPRVCHNDGKNGAMIFDGYTFIDIEPYRVKAVDTNGAGDMFAGFLLWNYQRAKLCGSG